MTPVASSPRSPYADVAALYDRWVEDPRYGGWIAGLIRVARTHGLVGSRVLDVGCGTGLSTLPMLALGLEVTACDPVPEMLARAETKIGRRANFVAAGLPDLPVLGDFDLVLAANDVINHVLGAEQLPDAVAAMAANLTAGGLLVIDANTLAAYRTFFASAHCREAGGARFAWRGLAPPDLPAGGLAEGGLDVFSPRRDGSWRRTSSRFVQRHHPHDEMSRALAGAGLSVLAVLGQHADGRRDPHADELDHIKRVYVSRKS
ncbi:MAG: Methyltransferase type 11 [Solirubrobacterales bacterium]|nr:Methyltransferase type 11 [Solirubrobacterales bacterium]